MWVDHTIRNSTVEGLWILFIDLFFVDTFGPLQMPWCHHTSTLSALSCSHSFDTKTTVTQAACIHRWSATWYNLFGTPSHLVTRRWPRGIGQLDRGPGPTGDAKLPRASDILDHQFEMIWDDSMFMMFVFSPSLCSIQSKYVQSIQYTSMCISTLNLLLTVRTQTHCNLARTPCYCVPCQQTTRGVRLIAWG